jgi:hypothetical protein
LTLKTATIADGLPNFKNIEHGANALSVSLSMMRQVI